MHEIHARKVGNDPSHLEILLNESREDKWWFRKNSSVTRPLNLIGLHSQTGIPFLCPEVVLLYKAISKQPMPKSEDDFDNVLEMLKEDQRDWLRRAIQSCNSKQAWLKRLS